MAKLCELRLLEERRLMTGNTGQLICGLSGVTRKVSILSPKMTVTVLNARRKEVPLFVMLDFG